MLLESPVLTFDTDVSDVPASVVFPDSSEPEGVPASTFTNALIAAVRCLVASSTSPCFSQPQGA